GGPEDRRPRAGAVGAVRRDGGARHGGHRRSDDGAGAGAGAARKVRRRRAERDQAELRGVSRAGARAHAEGRGVVKRHIVLIGLPGSGKSAVGRLVAEQLRAGFVDIDAIVERREGRPITLIFAEKGEAAFRDMERKEMETALAGEPAVIAPGGGWAAQPGAIDTAQPHALVIYLHTRPETAAQRAAPAGTRPTLMGEDPVERRPRWPWPMLPSGGCGSPRRPLPGAGRARSSSSSPPPRPRRSVSTWAQATRSRRTWGTCAICRSASSAWTWRTASRPST